jgi:hypothetical protein
VFLKTKLCLKLKRWPALLGVDDLERKVLVQSLG